MIKEILEKDFIEQLESIKQFLHLNGYTLVKNEEEPKKIDSIENLVEEYTKKDEDFEWKGKQCPNLYADPNNNGEFDVSKVISILDEEVNTEIHFTKDYCEHCGSMYFKKNEKDKE